MRTNSTLKKHCTIIILRMVPSTQSPYHNCLNIESNHNKLLNSSDKSVWISEEQTAKLREIHRHGGQRQTDDASINIIYTGSMHRVRRYSEYCGRQSNSGYIFGYQKHPLFVRSPPTLCASALRFRPSAPGPWPAPSFALPLQWVVPEGLG